MVIGVFRVVDLAPTVHLFQNYGTTEVARVADLARQTSLGFNRGKKIWMVPCWYIRQLLPSIIEVFFGLTVRSTCSGVPASTCVSEMFQACISNPVRIGIKTTLQSTALMLAWFKSGQNRVSQPHNLGWVVTSAIGRC